MWARILLHETGGRHPYPQIPQELCMSTMVPSCAIAVQAALGVPRCLLEAALQGSPLCRSF